MSTPYLSFYVLTYNSERYLADVLSRVAPVVDEMIVLDSGSTDRTQEIAGRHGARWHVRPFDDFPTQRTHAISLCRGEWVLSLDADELPDQEFVDEIARLKNSELVHGGVDAYRIVRHWMFLGRRVRALYPVASPDHPMRLHKREGPTFDRSNQVHETMSGADCVQLMQSGAVIHHSFETPAETRGKLQHYTDLAAQDLLRKGKRVGGIPAAVHAAGAAIKWYLVRQGWRDGVIGLRATGFAVRYSWLKYRKAGRLLAQRSKPEPRQS